MAANMKAVKLRIKSVQSTMQITKAMELVASSKLRRAKDRSDQCRPYFRELHQTLADIAEGNTDFSSVYAKPAAGSRSQADRYCYVVIAGDRGLAGGYNSNLFKKLEAAASQNLAGEDSPANTGTAAGTDGKAANTGDYVVLPIGKKAVEYFQRRGVEILTEDFATVADVSVADCFEIARLLCREYREGQFGHIELCYTEFVSMLSQRPQIAPMLPLTDLESDADQADAGDGAASEKKPVRDLILYEPDSTEVFDAIVPEYLGGLIYGGVCDALASELAARRNAMEAATSNAEEMIGKLNLSYNRARQSSITTEITEIVAGAEGV
ncbi:MAG: ATP synthase F1 subunit gamma [Clostridiales bacterium]|nr:ATP synthase F1 subunit gamma [Clostridiales bacterium]